MLMAARTAETPPVIVIVENWFEELKKRVPGTIGRRRAGPRRHFSDDQAKTMRVAGAVVLAPQISPTITRAIFAPPTDDGSIWLA